MSQNHEHIEDMSRYCPSNECSECPVALCDYYGMVYERCECDECVETRRRLREAREWAKGWMKVAKLRRF